MTLWKKETFEYYDDRITKVRQEKLELQKKVDDKEIEEQSLLEKRRDFGIKNTHPLKPEN